MGELFQVEVKTTRIVQGETRDQVLNAARELQDKVLVDADGESLGRLTHSSGAKSFVTQVDVREYGGE